MKYNNICKKINIISIVLIAVAISVNLYMSDKASVAGNDLAEYQIRIRELTLENESLENKYAQAFSMSNLTRLALENGFIDSQSEFYTTPNLALR